MNSIETGLNEDLPLELIQNAELATMETLPEKSRDKYFRVYNHFKDWQKVHGVTKISSELMLSYFYELKKKNAPTSLWAYYSMLKATIQVKENVDIGKFAEINSFLKTKSSGYKSTKADVFSEQQLKKIMEEAADVNWLDVKVK